MKRRERKTESVYLRMPQSLRRVVEAEAERQGRGLADTLRIIIAWYAAEQQRRMADTTARPQI
jgi:hypothetical protein